ncbi:putative deoxyribonuclease RhsC [compost metagenome]
MAVELPDGSTARYDYDAFGRRIRKTLNGQKGQGAELVTEFLWQANNLIAESRSDGIYRSFVYEPGSFKPLVQLEGEGEQAEVYHYQLDHLGTPLALTHHDGHTAWQVRYRAYGNVWKQELAEVDTPLRFQGQYFDAETGLHYNRHRYYQPDTGRFITPDPIGLAGGLNNYQYAHNPTGWVDPLGLSNVPGQCPPVSTVPEGVPLSQHRFDEILKTPKGERPSPELYLPSAYIDAHLAQFDNGATRFMTQSNLEKYGIGQRDGTSFVMPNAEADRLLSVTRGNARGMEDALGLPNGFLESNNLVRVDINTPAKFNLRIPSGNEAGSNELWIPGGKLPNGNSEAIIDVKNMQFSDYLVTPLVF